MSTLSFQTRENRYKEATLAGEKFKSALDFYIKEIKGNDFVMFPPNATDDEKFHHLGVLDAQTLADLVLLSNKYFPAAPLTADK